MTPDEDAPPPLIKLTARAVRRTALRALLLGALLFCCLLVLERGVRRAPRGELALMALFAVCCVGLPLAPFSLLELSPGPRPGGRALAIAWPLGALGGLLALPQLVYAAAMLETTSMADALEVVGRLGEELLRAPEAFKGLLVLGVALPTVFLAVTAIRLELVSPRARDGIIFFTFPSCLIALGVFALVDRLDERLFPAVE